MEAKFLAPPATAPIPNAQRTVLGAGNWNGSQLVPFTRSEWAALGATWKTVETKTRSAASEDFKKLSVKHKRDRKNVIEYVELSSPEGLVPSAILAPELGGKFADTLGEVLLFAVPSRSRAFLFPEFGTDISKFSGLIWDAYRETPYPVSVELFEWRKGTIQAVGLFEK